MEGEINLLFSPELGMKRFEPSVHLSHEGHLFQGEEEYLQIGVADGPSDVASYAYVIFAAHGAVHVNEKALLPDADAASEGCDVEGALRHALYKLGSVEPRKGYIPYHSRGAENNRGIHASVLTGLDDAFYHFVSFRKTECHDLLRCHMLHDLHLLMAPELLRKEGIAQCGEIRCLKRLRTAYDEVVPFERGKLPFGYNITKKEECANFPKVPVCA